MLFDHLVVIFNDQERGGPLADKQRPVVLQRMLSCGYTENDDRPNRSKADRLDFEVTA